MKTLTNVGPIRRRFSNGLTVIYLHTPTDPVSACHLFLPAGACHESDYLSGVGTLTWALITKGSKKRDARHFAEDVEAIGASVSAGVTHDYSEVSCHAIADYLPQAVELMAEALFDPVFSQEETLKERTALLAAIRSKKESIFTVANEELNRRLYGKHPYARPATGQEKSVARLTSKSVAAWHRSVVAPNGAVLSIATSRPAASLLPLVEKLFGPSAWKRASARGLARVGKTSSPLRAQRAVLNERFEQAYLLVGYPAPSVSTRDYLALKVLNSVLGGGMSARLFQQLREQQGLAYDVGSFFPSKLHGSAFVAYMGLQRDRMDRAKEGIMSAFADVVSKPVPAQELEQTKAYLKGTYILDHQTNSQRAHYLGWWEALGLGYQFDGTYVRELERVSAARVQSAARSVMQQPPVIVEIHPGKKPAPRPAETGA